MPNKPIQDWTFAEIKEYCAQNLCYRCVFQRDSKKDSEEYGCILKTHVPVGWEAPNRYSKEAIEAAKHIKALLPLPSDPIGTKGYRIESVSPIHSKVGLDSIAIMSVAKNCGLMLIHHGHPLFNTLLSLSGTTLEEIIKEGD